MDSYCQHRAPDDEDDRVRPLLAVANEIARRGMKREEIRDRWSLTGTQAGQLRSADPAYSFGWRKLRAIAHDLGFQVKLKLTPPPRNHRLPVYQRAA